MKIGKIFVDDVKGGQLESLSCAELIKRMLAGTSGAFGVLYGRYYSFVRNVCLKKAKNREIADDLAQATFLKALERIRFFRPDGEPRSFRRWISRIACHLSIDYLRSSSQDRKAIGIALERGMVKVTGKNNPAKSVQKKEARDIFLDTVNELPYPTRQCIISHYYLGLKYEDICEAYLLTENQVTHQLFVGRRILARKLRDLFS